MPETPLPLTLQREPSLLAAMGEKKTADDYMDFEKIQTSIYHVSPPKSRDLYDCDCRFDSEIGLASACGDDCLNRQLRVECSPKRCLLHAPCAPPPPTWAAACS